MDSGLPDDPDELVDDAGLTARKLARQEGVSASELSAAGFRASDLSGVGKGHYGACELRDAGCDWDHADGHLDNRCCC